MTEMLTVPLALAFGGLVMLYMSLACTYMILVLVKEARKFANEHAEEMVVEHEDYREVVPAP